MSSLHPDPGTSAVKGPPAYSWALGPPSISVLATTVAQDSRVRLGVWSGVSVAMTATVVLAPHIFGGSNLGHVAKQCCKSLESNICGANSSKKTRIAALVVAIALTKFWQCWWWQQKLW